MQEDRREEGERRARLLGETARLVDIGQQRSIKSDFAHELILAMYARIAGLFQAVTAVLAQRLAEEAMIVARSLFTESLWLMELAAADEMTRKQKVLRWADKGLARYIEILRNGKRERVGPPDVLERGIAAAEENRRFVQQKLLELREVTSRSV